MKIIHLNRYRPDDNSIDIKQYAVLLNLIGI